MKIFDNLHAFLWNNPTANNANTYLINGVKKILIDPGHYHLMNHIRQGLSELSMTLEDIDLVIITHAHSDHIEGIEAFLNTSTLIAVNKKDMAPLQGITHRLVHANGTIDPIINLFLDEGDLQVGDMKFQVIHSPGHSPGSICLYWPENKVLFTGDVVFNQGIGRTDLHGGDGSLLKQSIVRLSKLDVEYLLPGHGPIVMGTENVKRNFQDIESMWFGYL
ncbi:MAG: MBL fold metallo-hydrolase [Deltaproteobacteria bacterium]|nr:MBL fold metallo-hydrolase [Deltaproteobacteria bacterium]